jgi:tetratricopeptide (TPR) repeat protein
MRSLGMAALALALVATGAKAAQALAEASHDAPVYAPAPAWVTPIKPPAITGAPNVLPIRWMLIDRQVRFEAEAQETYTERVMRAQSPEGLQGLGNLIETWDPQTDELVINKLLILRGDEVIDVLAPGPDGAPGKRFNVLRRETNLERSMLDGRLTASLQLEGLQVGDIVDVATTVRHHDPSFKSLPEMELAPPPGLPIDRLYMRLLWPQSLPVKWRKSDILAAPKVTQVAGQTELLLDMAQVKIPNPPKLAPRRFSEPGRMEASAYTSWTDVSQRLAPLFMRAETLNANSPLKAEASRIRALSKDRRVQASEALKLVEDRVRYVFLGEDLGGYKPVTADLSWTRRFADCKGKTVLLAALLRELGLDAEPVLVSTVQGDGMDERLPSLLTFNHAIVRLKLNGRLYWLDATRSGDTDIDRLDPPSYRWALPVAASGARLEPIDQPPLNTPLTAVSLRIDARQGLTAPAPTHVEVVMRGDRALLIDRAIRSSTPKDLETSQRNFWRGQFPWITVQHVSATYDPATGEAKEAMDGLAQLAWLMDDAGRGGRFAMSLAALGRTTDFKRDPDTRLDAPYAVNYPDFDTGDETLILPNGGLGYRLEGRDVDRMIGGVRYQRTASIEGGAAVVHVSSRAMAREFPANAAYTTQFGLAALTSEGVWVRAPVAYNLTKQDLAGVSAIDPITTEDYFKRAVDLLQKWETDRALADFDEVLRREPAMPAALLGRAELYLRKGQLKAALKDLDAALAAQPDNLAALYTRSQARLEANEPDLALADADAAVRFAPRFIDPYDNRARLYLRRRAPEKALADYNAMLAIDPESKQGLAGRARAYAALGKAAMARADLAAIGESANILNDRCYDRATANLTLDIALSECDAAVRQAPASASILDSRGFVRFRLGDLKGAVTDFDAALAFNPKMPPTLFVRGLAKRRLGDRVGGDLDVAAAKAMDAEVARTIADYGVTQ